MLPRHLHALVLLAASATAMSTCLEDPSMTMCQDYIYPDANATADLTSLCGAMTNMPGCTLWTQCQKGTISGKFCTPFSLLGDICLSDTMASMNGCQNIGALCGSSTSVVQQCQTEAPLPNVLTTAQATTDAVALCTSMPSMTACSACTSQTKCSDPLGTVISVCLDMTMSGCSNWQTMCDSVASSGQASNMQAVCGTAAVVQTCFENPAQDSCSSFSYPAVNSTADITKLCSSMPNMVGCSIWTHCSSGALSGKFCQPFSVLGDICAKDTGMSSMTGCENYISLCSNSSSKVQQCSTQSSIPNILTTSAATASILQMCNEMSMEGCSQCSSSSNCPDPLFTISELCLSMEMNGCSDWQTMCSAISSSGESSGFSSVCGGVVSSNSIPLMRMYFHTGIVDYVLFKDWVPRTSTQYAFTFLAVVLMGIAVIFLKSCRHYYDESLKLKEEGDQTEESPLLNKKKISPNLWKAIMPGQKELLHNSVRAAFMIPIVTLDFALMLVAMTFNVGLFVAVVLGYVLGTLIFGHGLVYLEADATSCCG